MIDASGLHRSVLTLDSHIDIPWPDTPDPFAPSNRLVDMVKMRAGGLDAGCFVAYVPQGPRTPEGHQAARDRAFAMLEVINGMGRSANGIDARACPSADAVEQAKRDGVIAVVPAMENGYPIGEDVALLARFRALGVTYVTICHNGHNLLCDSANPRPDLGDGRTLHGGLSELGRAAITEMNRLGILVDVAHMSRQSMLQAVMQSKTPVVASHSCVHALAPHPRNLDDTQLDALRDTGGLVQITAMPPFLRPRGRVDTVRVSDFVDHIDYVVQRCGIAHVGISSDFDGGGAISGWRDASESENLTEELVRRNYGAAEITALWGGNFLRLMRVAEQAAEATPADLAAQ